MITQITSRCIAVEISDYQTHLKGSKLYHKEPMDRHWKEQALPLGNWQILGRPNELSEEQWKQIVTAEKTFGYPSFGQESNGSYQWYAKASESGLALIKSKNLNPENIILLIKKEVSMEFIN